MLEQYTTSTAGPKGEPGVVIAHVEANVHLHRTLAQIRECTPPRHLKALTHSHQLAVPTFDVVPLLV